MIDSEIIKSWLKEDGWGSHLYYESSLPQDFVSATLFVKENMVLCGLPVFFDVFRALGAFNDREIEILKHNEGKVVSAGLELQVFSKISFANFLWGERLALNLLQRASACATLTKSFVDKSKKYQIKICDTRKTTPGLRALEKYAVRIGGGFNHRFTQTDSWMIKDNHKKFFGGIEPALKYFKSQQTAYHSIIVEIHSLKELQQALDLRINHVMLDNFSPDEVRAAILLKKEGMTFEVSGGITQNSLENYCIPGVDLISVGQLTHSAPQVNLSLKCS